jgi:RNA polymerase sigma-70 factor, ECF subfamily
MRSDEELMLAYARGEDAAFRELFARYAPILSRISQRQIGRPADASDIVQQTFLQLHRARHDFDAAMRFKPWVITITMNLGRDLLRRRSRWRESDVDAQVLVATDPEKPDEEAQQKVRAALAKLPRDQREVIELHWFEELSFNEIAEIVGAKPGAVRVRAHRGYEALRRVLV